MVDFAAGAVGAKRYGAGRAGVWGGIVGTLLLLLKRRLAAPVLLISFLSMVITAIYNYGVTNGIEVMGKGALVFTVFIFLIALG